MSAQSSSTPVLQYFLNVEDHAALFRWLFRSERGRIKWLARYAFSSFCLMMSGASVLVTWIMAPNSAGTVGISFFFWLGMALIWPLQFFVARSIKLQQIRNSPSFGALVTLRLDGDGVHLDDTISEGFYPWGDIHKIVETEEQLFLLYTKEAAIIVPKSAFGSLQKLKEFLTFAHDSWHQAHPTEQVAPLALP